MKFISSAIIFSTLLLASCSSNEVQKKILVMGKGTIVVTEKNVNMTKGSGYAEKEIDIRDKEATTLTVETEKGKQDISVPAEGGYYILNLKSDTIAGSIQLMGKDISNNTVMTQEVLKSKIDSLATMTTGKNINFKTNFMVLPNQLLKITTNKSAQVFGPFRKIPAELEVSEDNKEPEIYKFYTNMEIRELIGRLKKLTY